MSYYWEDIEPIPIRQAPKGNSWYGKNLFTVAQTSKWISDYQKRMVNITELYELEVAYKDINDIIVYFVIKNKLTGTYEINNELL